VAAEPHHSKVIALRPAEIVGALVFAAALYGCRTDPAAAGVPAHIVDATPDSRAELEKIVSRALNGADVTLADDALTRDSVLSIDRKTFRDTRGNPINGREPGMPIQFVLLKQGDRCVLELRSSGQQWNLPATKCAAE
jgi:hypothetical protein